MGRRFTVAHGGRALSICVRTVDEAWELWICERGRRLLLGATVPIDGAIEQWRKGLDPIEQSAAYIREGMEQGLFRLPTGSDEDCPSQCLVVDARHVRECPDRISPDSIGKD